MRICVALLLLSFFLVSVTPLNANAKTGIAVPEMAACDNKLRNFIINKGVPGLSFALARDGRIVYSRGFGKADLAGMERMQPYHMFRIASVSKAISSIAIFRLKEAGALRLSDKVFGVGGLLEHHPDFSVANIVDSRIYDITVNMLLTHTAGWNSKIICTPKPTSPYAFQAKVCDPGEFPLHVTEVLGRENPVTEGAKITFLLERGLNQKPNTGFHYSNTGFLVIGEIIKTLSGMPYEQYVQTEILHPLGIYDMHIGRSLYEDKRVREAEYMGFGKTALSSYGDGTRLPEEYGGGEHRIGLLGFRVDRDGAGPAQAAHRRRRLPDQA